MYVAVIEVDSGTTPHVILGQSVQGVNRRIAQILTVSTWTGSEVEQFVQQRPAPLDDPEALAVWLADFHEDFTEPWVSTYVTTQCVPTDTAIEAVDSPWTLRDAPIPFVLT